MDIEVVLPEDSGEILKDRINMPLFFLLGGADDEYLSQLVGQPIQDLVKSKSLDPIPPLPYVVFASRAPLPTSGYARTFSLEQLLNEEWPILLDLTSDNPNNLGSKIPTNVERTWIIRALRRAGMENLANQVRTQMLNGLYPKKLSIDQIPVMMDIPSLNSLYGELSSRQLKYPLIIIMDDLPIQLPKSLGDALAEIALTGCISGLDGDLLLKGLQTSLELLKMPTF